jgi:hypothetical protein
MRRIYPVDIGFIELTQSHILSHFFKYDLGHYGLNICSVRDKQLVVEHNHGAVDRCRRLLVR